jgi:hypothetical protein
MVSLARTPFLPGDGGAAAFQSLEESRQVRGRVHASKKVHMGSNHAQLEHMGLFLAGDAT